jgi:hypothetical protein
MHVPANTARIIVVVALAAIVILMLVTGLADDKAPPGSGGRVPVTHTGTNDSPSSRWRRSPTRRSGPTQHFRLAAASRCLHRGRRH